MENEGKKVYCEQCKTHDTVAPDVFFCPVCCSIYVDDNEEVEKEQ